VKKIYRYAQDFGRMGGLECVFVAEEELADRMLARGGVGLGEVLGKHSDIAARFDDKTFSTLTDDPAIVTFFEEHLGGYVGLNLVERLEEIEADERYAAEAAAKREADGK
jgi:hypothetical protein